MHGESAPLLFSFGRDSKNPTGEYLACYYELSAGENYIRYYGREDNREAYFTVYKNSAGNKVTGQYVVFKYRISTELSQNISQFEIFAGNKADVPQGNGDFFKADAYIQDNQWHLAIIDISSLDAFVEKNGTYSARYFRLDIFNNLILDGSSYIDVAYVGMADSLENICKFNSDMEEATFVQGSDYKTVKLDNPTNW